MLIGYARVSTHDQTLNLQLDSLKAAGCARIFEDHISGTKAERPGLQEAFSHLRAGDTLVVWRLEGIGFKSLQENIDTTRSSGKLIFHIFGSLAEFERDLIRERTQAGLEAARSRGRVGGRPRTLDTKKTAIAQALYNDKKHTAAEIYKTLGISRATLYRYLIRQGSGKKVSR
jgi:DNA invertase Pin-like site-specific DNA recombinase